MTWKSWRIGLLRFRLRSHMYARLAHGGSPDCPCERCRHDREHFLELAGEPWDDPERAAYYRELYRPLASRVESEFFCECDDESCSSPIALTLDEWEAARNKYPAAAHFYIVLKDHDFGEPIVFSGKGKSGVAFDVVQGYPNVPHPDKQP